MQHLTRIPIGYEVSFPKREMGRAHAQYGLRKYLSSFCVNYFSPDFLFLFRMYLTQDLKTNKRKGIDTKYTLGTEKNCLF